MKRLTQLRREAARLHAELQRLGPTYVELKNGQATSIWLSQEMKQSYDETSAAYHECQAALNLMERDQQREDARKKAERRYQERMTKKIAKFRFRISIHAHKGT